LAIIHPKSEDRAKIEAGFTLVEVLCVLALLGLTAGLVVVNLPKPAPPLKAEMQQVTGLLNLAVRQSVIDGKSRGLDVGRNQLEIFEYDGEWILEHQHDLDVSGIDLVVEGQNIDLRLRDKKKETAELSPLVYFDAVGNVTPFRLSIEGDEESYHLEPDERGRLALEITP